MTHFQDKTEREQRDEIRTLIIQYAKTNGDPIPGEDQLTADVEQILNDLKTRTTPAGPAVSAGSGGGK